MPTHEQQTDRINPGCMKRNKHQHNECYYEQFQLLIVEKVTAKYKVENRYAADPGED